ncbi:MAG: hypothetical protein CMF31_01790 [Kordiimonas sp.]|nr:hypothetical protein [Kordiimonas sp.]
MNIEEYTQYGFGRYGKFAQIVRDLLEVELEAAGSYRLQQIQCRAKTIDSLKRRLAEKGQSDSSEIELCRKDLAGCRILFYTNNDVNRFTSSGLLTDLFDVDWQRSKFHHPHPGEKSVDRLFQSNNYVVKLKADRTSLREYREFEGLYCEVQVQTTLNHAWAEMAHDTIYKKPELDGFEEKEAAIIGERLRDVMQKHLLPAGYLFQQIATDVERLAEGKRLFDQGVLRKVLTAKNNNERHEALRKLKEDVLPYYDDLETIVPEIRTNLKEVWIAAEVDEVIPHETPFGNFSGCKPSDVTGLIADIIDEYRYIDAGETYAFIRYLYAETSTAEAKEQLVKIAEHLACPTLQVWEKLGPYMQVQLADILTKEEDIAPYAQLALAIAREILSSEITGTTAGSETVTFHRGAIRYSEELKDARRAMIDLIANHAETVISDEDALQRAISILFEAGELPRLNDESAEVAAMIYGDLAYAFERITSFINGTSLSIRQETEYILWLNWRSHKTLPDRFETEDDVKVAHGQLSDAMGALREKLNADDEFAIFKTIVGFRSVFPHMWGKYEYDRERDEKIRYTKQDELIQSVTSDTWPQWKERLGLAACVKSSDLAFFPPYSRFLSVLAARHTEFAIELLRDREATPAWTIQPIARALLGGERQAEMESLLINWLKEGQFISEIAKIAAFSESVSKELVHKAKKYVIKSGKWDACEYMLDGAVRRFSDDPALWRDEVFFPCLKVLREADITIWVDRIGYSGGEESLFCHLTDEQAQTLLNSMISMKRVNYPAEQILTDLGEERHDVILDWFGERLKYAKEVVVSDYDAVPFSFQSVHTILQPYPDDVIAHVRLWQEDSDVISSWDRSHFLSKVYPAFEVPLSTALFSMIESGDTSDLAFIIASLKGYDGREDLLPLLRAVLSSDEVTDDIERAVSLIFHETGTMTGDFGRVEACQEKVRQLEGWLADGNTKVVQFAEKEIRSLKLQIADFTRHTQQNIAMRKLEYGEDLDNDTPKATESDA